MKNNTRSGYVAIVGQPNVGKSTLMNYCLGKKLSITSRKPQTTRHRILGVKTIDDVQIMYMDTPGLHLSAKKAMNKIMNRVARAALHDVNVVVFMVEALHWDEQDEWILKLLQDITLPVVLVINKIDKIKDRRMLLPFIEKISDQYSFAKVIPLSAKQGDQVEEFEQEIISLLPEDVHYYSPEHFTDRSDRFVAAEFVREKLMRLLGQEIPYAVTVMIDAFEEDDKIIRVSAIIYVEKDSQKSIVIGEKGAKLKAVGTAAREDMEMFFDKKIFVKLWVKVKGGWSDDERALRSLGYNDE